MIIVISASLKDIVDIYDMEKDLSMYLSMYIEKT